MLKSINLSTIIDSVINLIRIFSYIWAYVKFIPVTKCFENVSGYFILEIQYTQQGKEDHLVTITVSHVLTQD